VIFVIFNVIASPEWAKQSQSVAKQYIVFESRDRFVAPLLAMTIWCLSDSLVNPWYWISKNNLEPPQGATLSRLIVDETGVPGKRDWFAI
jgi:hypothetical protein